MTASALEIRSANLASAMTMNGMTTGNVDTITRMQTPNAPRQSRLVSLAWTSDAGTLFILSRMSSSCVGCRAALQSCGEHLRD